MRIGAYGGPLVLPRSRIGEVLAIVDSDDDGWAEILVTSHAYEATHITAYEYGESGLQQTGAWFAWGC